MRATQVTYEDGEGRKLVIQCDPQGFGEVSSLVSEVIKEGSSQKQNPNLVFTKLKDIFAVETVRTAFKFLARVVGIKL